MPAENTTPIIIKKHIQTMLSKPKQELNEEDKKIIEIINKYKVVNQEELKRLSKEFGNVINPP